VLRLGVRPRGAYAALDQRIVSMISVCREHYPPTSSGWGATADGVALGAAGIVEAGKQFRRVTPTCTYLPLRAALGTAFTKDVTTLLHNEALSLWLKSERAQLGLDRAMEQRSVIPFRQRRSR